MVKIENIANQVKGDDLTLNVTVKSEGEVFDVSGSTSLLTIKLNYADDDLSAISQVSGVFSTDGTDGKIEFNAPSVDLNSIDISSTYVYDIQVTLSNGRKYTIVSGNIKFIDEVTQS